MLDIKVIRKAVKNWPEGLRKVNSQFIPRAGKVVLASAKRNAPKDKGGLINSLGFRAEKDVAIVYSSLYPHYAPDVEYGTRAHTIVVNGPVFLKSKKSGVIGWRYLKTVRHPGTKAQPFMRPAIDKNRRKLRTMWRDLFRRVYGR